MRVEGGDGEGLRLVASLHDLHLVDDAFPELLENADLDDWVVRTGATRDEVAATWAGIAGVRPHALPGGELGWLSISERAIEILEAVLFEVARARTLPPRSIEARTGTPLAEWQRLWRLADALLRELRLGGPDAPAQVAAAGMLGPDGSSSLSRFRQVGIEVRDAVLQDLSLEIGDVRDLAAERCQVRDVACRGVRLIASRLRDVDVAVAIHGGAVIDCVLDGVAIAGTLSDVRLIGNVCRLLDLRRAALIGCRFYEASPGEDVLLPDGRDCFVVGAPTALRALEPLRGRLGAPTFKALSRWLGEDGAAYVSVGGAGGSFWQREIVRRGGDRDPEVEADALDRLFRVRVGSIGGRARLACEDPIAVR